MVDWDAEATMTDDEWERARCPTCSTEGRKTCSFHAGLTYDEAMKRLAGCRALQPDAMQIIVGAEIVDALLAQPLPDTAQSGPANAQPLRADGSSFSEAQSGPQNAGCGCDDCPVAVRLRAELAEVRHRLDVETFRAFAEKWERIGNDERRP